MQAEHHFIQMLTAKLKNQPAFIKLGIGDDTAHLGWEDSSLLATTDMLMDGTHFRLTEGNARQVGHKALAVNLSDIAAMGGTPRAALVSIGVPKGKWTVARKIMAGLLATAKHFQVAVVGGDTNSWNGPLVINVALLGVPFKKPITRAGARPGDGIFVTGALGGSLQGRHLTFTPRLAEAHWLVKHLHPTAMMDLSDGLATDLRHILKASGVGAVLHPQAIPIHRDVKSRKPQERLKAALCDGEDFELLFTLPRKEEKRCLGHKAAGRRFFKIGEITKTPGLCWDDEEKTPITWAGWEHR